jgi:hypothetical protein
VIAMPRPLERGGRRLTVLLALTTAALPFVLSPRVAAQDAVSTEATIEPAVATVGDPLTLTIVVRHPQGTEVEAPEVPDAFAPLELIQALPPEGADAGGRRETRLVFTLAAFQTGEVRPPPVRVPLAGGETDAISVDVPSVTIESVLPPSGELDLRDLPAPLTVSAGAPAWVWAVLVMTGFVALSAATMALARVAVRRAPPAPPVTPEEPPEAAARAELDAIAADGPTDAGDVKEHYQRISGCLRRFLSASLDLPAGALTAAELEGRLEAAGTDRLAARLAINLLAQCEAVLFAGYEPARERAEADLAAAYQVISLIAGVLPTPAEDASLVAP